MKRAAVVLLYHRIVDDPPELPDYSPGGITVRRDAFDAQMAFLRRHYRLTSLPDIVGTIAGGGRLTDRLCAVTFDDGWRDNYTHAFPILLKHRVPCTIFLTPSFIEATEWDWHIRFKHLVSHLVQCYRNLRGTAADRAAIAAAFRREGLDAAFALPLQELRRLLKRKASELQAAPPAERERVIGVLESWRRVDGFEEPRHFMTWDELREMEAAGVQFGAHTMTHPHLHRCDAATADAEIRGSREAIARHVDRPCPLFAYPYGKHTPQMRELVEKAGFVAAFTTKCGHIRAGADLLRLNRIDIHDEVAPSLAGFACRVLHFMGSY